MTQTLLDTYRNVKDLVTRYKKKQNKEESMVLLSTLIFNPEKLASAPFPQLYKWKSKNISMTFVSQHFSLMKKEPSRQGVIELVQ